MRSLPGEASVAQVAGMAWLGAGTLGTAVTPPYAWWRELADQAWVLIVRSLGPAIVSAMFIGLAIAVQGGNFLGLVGSTDRIGSGYVIGSVREFAPFVAGVVVAGVGGTAICADLGARRIREELDALITLGVDVQRFLVLPRVLALALVTVLMNSITMAFGALGAGASAAVMFDVSPASFMGTFAASFSVPDLLGSVVKSALLGFVIGVIATFKGINASGGAEGVGRAVNQAVVVAFLAIFVINFTFNSALLAMFPETTQVR